VYILLLKRDTTFITNRRFLIGGIITSVVLPSIYFTKTVILKAQVTRLPWAESNFPINDSVIQKSMMSPLEIFTSLYLLGVILMTGRLILQLHSLSRILLSGKLIKTSGRKFIEISEKIAPFSFLNFVAYNPSLHSKTELDLILIHEKAHVNQSHTFDVLLANINLIYQWFNPVAWLYLKNIQQALEFIADREAVKKAGCKKEHQKALVKASVENC